MSRPVQEAPGPRPGRPAGGQEEEMTTVAVALAAVLAVQLGLLELVERKRK